MAKKIKNLFLKVRLYVFLLGTIALDVLVVNIDSLLSNVVAIYVVIIIVALVNLAFVGYVISIMLVGRRQKMQSQSEDVEREDELSLFNENEASLLEESQDQEKTWPLGEYRFKQSLKGFKTNNAQIKDESQYNSPENLYEYVNELSMFMLSKGIEISKNCIREMLASLAASKVIHFTHKDVELANKTVDALLEFVGFDCVEHDGSTDYDGANPLFQQESEFYRFLQYADSYRSQLQVLSITKVDAKRIDECYKPIIKYAVDPLLPVHFGQELESEITISKNTWITFISATKEDVDYSKDFAEGVITITLDSELIESDAPEHVHTGKMTYEMLRDLLEDSYEEFYMDESFLKKVDELENYLKKYTTFNIDNRLFRQIERFASIFIAFGGEKVDVFDAIMHNKLIHLLALLDFSELIRLKQDLMIEIDKLFGLENLYRCKPILKEILERQNDVS